MHHLLLMSRINTAPAVWTALGMLAAIGAVALFCPDLFRKIAVRSNHWIDTNKILSYLDRRIDIDHHVLPFTRHLGIAVLAAVCAFGVIYAKYGLAQ